MQLYFTLLSVKCLRKCSVFFFCCNFSCSSNLVNYQVLVESMDHQLAHIGFYASRDVCSLSSLVNIGQGADAQLYQSDLEKKKS